MKKYYVLIDAMGIQNYIFETNNLKIIAGASLALARWQKECADLKQIHIVFSAGGNILAWSSDKELAVKFKNRVLDMAPPGLEIAWAIVEEVDDHKNTSGGENHPDFIIWQKLQKQIGRYKCGDMDAGDYKQPDPGISECNFCGKREISAKLAGTEAACKECASNYHTYTGFRADMSAGSVTLLESLYLKAREIGFQDIFPDDLKTLVQKKEGEDNDLLALIVIDINNLGERVKEKVKKKGFECLGGFAAGLEELIAGIWKGLIQDLSTNWKPYWGLTGGNKGDQHLKIRPLLMAGDDMVVAVPARIWPKIVEKALSALEENGYPPCAGVVIIPHTFPISRVMQMGEDIIHNAKGFLRLKEKQKESGESDCSKSAIDWHLHQQSSYTSPLFARRTQYFKEMGRTKAGIKQISYRTKRPYTLADFKNINSHVIEGEGSKRKLFHIYESLSKGPEQTRNTIVYSFFRKEDEQLTRHPWLWKLIEEADGDFPLWDKRNLHIEREDYIIHETAAFDILELAAFTIREDKDA